MSDDVAVLPLQFTEAAAKKVKNLIADEENPELKLRVYITGGGCSGFQYGFTFDDQMNDGDMTIEKQGVALVVDPMSLQYLVGGSVDYTRMRKPPAAAVLLSVSDPFSDRRSGGQKLTIQRSLNVTFPDASHRVLTRFR